MRRLRNSKNAWISILWCLFILAATLAKAQNRDVASPKPALPSEAPIAGKTNPEPAPPPRAPVIADGRTLFYIQVGVYSYTPEQRANGISRRIERLYRDPTAYLDLIRVEDHEEATEIAYKDMFIMGVSDADAKAAGRDRRILAKQYAQVIKQTTLELQYAYSTKAIVKGAVYTLIATLVLVLALILLKQGFKKLYAIINSWRTTKFHSIQIQKVQLLSSGQISEAMIRLARFGRLVITLALLDIYLTLAFSFFPWTQSYASHLYETVMGPLRDVVAAMVGYLPNVFYIAAIGLVTYFAIRIIRFLFVEVGKGAIEIPGFYPDWALPTFKIARIMLLALAAIMAFPYLPGSDSLAFKGMSIFLGVLFSLGSTSAVANAVAGMVLTYTRAFQIGDRVKIGDAVGDVIQKTMLVTRIHTIKNVDISIPNSMVIGSQIVNYSSAASKDGLILNTTVTIGYDAPWRTVHELLIAAAAATPGILKDPSPFVLQTSLNDFFVTYEINAYTDRPLDMADIYSDMHQNIQDKFNEAHVEIMSPHYTSVRDGNTIAIPQNDRPKDYSPPAFRVLNMAGPVAPKTDKPSSE